MTQARIAYISFDVVPAPKGAAIHIQTFAEALGQRFGRVQLVTVSPQRTTIAQKLSPEIHQTVLPAIGKTLIDRVLSFRQALWGWLRGQVLEAGPFDVIHLRSPFEGFPIVLHQAKLCRRLIFEVNGLPSIELKYRYPQVADDDELMHKLVAQEDACLLGADCVLTPSDVTRAYLIQRGVGGDRIQVIPNGVDRSVFTYHPPRPDPVLSPLKLVYFGTLSPWQGVDLAIDALALYRRDGEAQLTIIGPSRPHQLKRLHTLAAKLQVTAHVQILDALPMGALVAHLHQADAIVAPLKGCDRNLVQGCCPLKVLEGMATGTPVITTDLPVVRAIGTPDQHFLAVKPNSPKGIKDALLQLRADPILRLTLSRQARQHVEQQFSWSLAHQRLIAVYESLLASP